MLRRRLNSSFLGALCLRLWDPLSPDFAPASTRPAFLMTDAMLPDPESAEPHRYRLQSEALVLASVLLLASTAALSGGAGGSAGLCAYHYLGTRLSRGAWLCVFAGPSIYSASHGRSLGRTLRSCSDLLSGDPGAALLV